MFITRDFLRTHPGHIFVFGDNDQRMGYGGAATLRDEPNTYGFITKKRPNNKDSSFYRPEEYKEVFEEELEKLKEYMLKHPEYVYLISQLGGGLANKYGIWEEVIKDRLEEEEFPDIDVVLLWLEDIEE